ncbi:FDLD family class I lanthipeptide [Clostridium botulinum]
MGKFDDFDLDVNVKKGNEKEGRTVSMFACFTYQNGCPTATMNSRCC